MKLENLEKYLSENNGHIILKADGTWGYSEWGVNYSSILTTLIKESAKCEYYSSDLFITWEYSVMENLRNMIGGEKKYCFFGFRDYGVDGNTFCNARLENNDNEYFSIYAITMEVIERSDGILEMEMILSKYK